MLNEIKEYLEYTGYNNSGEAKPVLERYWSRENIELFPNADPKTGSIKVGCVQRCLRTIARYELFTGRDYSSLKDVRERNRCIDEVKAAMSDWVENVFLPQWVIACANDPTFRNCLRTELGLTITRDNISEYCPTKKLLRDPSSTDKDLYDLMCRRETSGKADNHICNYNLIVTDAIHRGPLKRYYLVHANDFRIKKDGKHFLACSCFGEESTSDRDSSLSAEYAKFLQLIAYYLVEQQYAKSKIGKTEYTPREVGIVLSDYFNWIGWKTNDTGRDLYKKYIWDSGSPKQILTSIGDRSGAKISVDPDFIGKFGFKIVESLDDGIKKNCTFYSDWGIEGAMNITKGQSLRNSLHENEEY